MAEAWWGEAPARPIVRRGAALRYSSSIGWQQAAPGNVSKRGSSIGCGTEQTRWVKHHAG